MARPLQWGIIAPPFSHSAPDLLVGAEILLPEVPDHADSESLHSLLEVRAVVGYGDVRARGVP